MGRGNTIIGNTCLRDDGPHALAVLVVGRVGRVLERRLVDLNDEAVERADAAVKLARPVEPRPVGRHALELLFVVDREVDLVPRVVDEREHERMDRAVQRRVADAVDVDDVEVRAAGEPAERGRDLQRGVAAVRDAVPELLVLRAQRRRRK